MRRPAALCRMLGVAAVIVTVLPMGWARALEIKRVKLDNGMIVLISPQHNLPMVTGAIAFDAGARRDPKGKEGYWTTRTTKEKPCRLSFQMRHITANICCSGEF
jgi:hypothetical protein